MKKILVVLVLLLAPTALFAQSEKWPDLGYQIVPHALSLPTGANFIETTEVALNSKGHIFVFHRGTQPLMEFDSNGDFIRTLGDGLFTMAHGLKIDADDNIWTTDVGSHLVLKLSPEGRVLLVLGRKGIAGEMDKPSGMPLFDKPADVAFDAMGNIYVADGYGNSRVVKFDKDGNFIKAWGKKGSGEGEFNLPHDVAIDAQGLVYVGDRENRRVQIFDADGNFLKQWTHAGSPWYLYITPDQLIYLVDGYASRILKLDRDGNILGVMGAVTGKAPGQFGLVHGFAMGPKEEIYTTEILNWRVQKFMKRQAEGEAGDGSNR
jgi:DNA-binding beta-propeller fold protein YncE